jgi:hypothetical protein
MSGGALTFNLAKYDAARKALAAARRVDEAKDIRNRAIALQAYARLAKDKEMQNWAAGIRLRAERRAGELLSGMAQQGQRHSGRGNNKKKLESKPTTPKLEDLGVSKDQSSKWQRLAKIEEPVFERIVEEADELTTATVLAAANAKDIALKKATKPPLQSQPIKTKPESPRVTELFAAIKILENKVDGIDITITDDVEQIIQALDSISARAEALYKLRSAA